MLFIRLIRLQKKKKKKKKCMERHSRNMLNKLISYWDTWGKKKNRFLYLCQTDFCDNLLNIIKMVRHLKTVHCFDIKPFCCTQTDGEFQNFKNPGRWLLRSVVDLFWDIS